VCVRERERVLHDLLIQNKTTTMKPYPVKWWNGSTFPSSVQQQQQEGYNKHLLIDSAHFSHPTLFTMQKVTSSFNQTTDSATATTHETITTTTPWFNLFSSVPGPILDEILPTEQPTFDNRDSVQVVF
jgi:hypothetical protein